VPAAGLELFTAVERQQVFATGLRFQMADLVEVDDRRTMDPYKPFGAEHGRQPVKGTSGQKTFGAYAHVHVVSRCFHEHDLGLFYEMDLFVAFDQNSANHLSFSVIRCRAQLRLGCLLDETRVSKVPAFLSSGHGFLMSQSVLLSIHLHFMPAHLLPNPALRTTGISRFYSFTWIRDPKLRVRVREVLR